jgi:hypothetical protein
MSELRDRITAALEKHAVAQYCWGPEGCSCDYKLDISDEDHPRHQADAVIAELGLEEELTYGGTMRRYVTDWKANDETD